MGTERRKDENRSVTIMNVVMELNTHVWTNERQGALIKYLENNEFLWSDANKDNFRDVATKLAKEWLAAYKPPKKKYVDVEIYLNGNSDGVTAELLVGEADTLLALWKEAQDTILQGMEDEDYWEKFDPWLKEKAPDIYKKIMDAFYGEYNGQMSNEPWTDEEWERANRYASLERDVYGVYLTDNNEVVINQIFPPSE